MAKPNIAIIGAGALGGVFAQLFARSGISVAVWDKDATKVGRQQPLSSVVSSARIILLCIPSQAIGEALVAVRPFLQKDCVIVSPIKGISLKLGKTTEQVIAGHLPRQPYVILGGPLLAEELKKNMGGVAVVTSRNKEAARSVGRLFHAIHVDVAYSTDVHGVALLGVLKNVYAISLGIAEGLGWGMNMRGALAARALSEMAALLAVLGGKAETAMGPAGLGDFIATGFSSYSRNHSVGIDLAKNKRPKFLGEGGVSLPALSALIRKKKSLTAFPLFYATAEIVTRKKNAEKVFERFCAHGKK